MNIDPRAAKKLELPSSAVTLLDHIFKEAITQRASDIHFDSGSQSGVVRLRTQDRLSVIFSPPLHLMPALMNRLKIMASLNITEHRLPQDGYLNLPTLDGQSVEARIAFIPTFFGEKASLRLFHHGVALTLDALGMTEQQKAICVHHLHQSSGLILIAGPTGSGKTTTLYAFLEYLKQQKQVHILSIENPIERALSGINQTAINPEIGLSFDLLLKSALRHDPDVLMIGEIRDHMGANIAIQAAETGHLVLSSIHASSSYEALLRLIHFGVDQHFLGSTLRMIINQRLVDSSKSEALGGQTAVFNCFTIDPFLKKEVMLKPIQTLSSSFETPPLQETVS